MKKKTNIKAKRKIGIVEDWLSTSGKIKIPARYNAQRCLANNKKKVK